MTLTARRVRLLSIVCIALAAAFASAGPAAATDPSTRAPAEIPWQWWDGGLHAVQNNGAWLPGLQDDSCRPSPRHPNPVILLHGQGASAQNNSATIGQALLNEGYCVWAPNYGVPPLMPHLGPMPVAAGLAAYPINAEDVAREVDRVRGLTGAAKVDLVGISQGTLAAGYTSKVLRPGAVDRVVAITGVWPTAGMASILEAVDAPPVFGSAAAAPGYDSFDRIERWLGPEQTPFADDVEYTLVGSRYDGLVPLQHTMARDTPGAHRVVLQDGCEVNRSNHLTLINDPRVVDVTLNALDPDHAVEPRCVPTDGLTGPALPVPPRAS